MMSRVGIGCLLSACFTAGCTHYLDRGTELYYQGHYIDAAHVFQNSEQQVSRAEPDQRASYAVYRGATLLRLGDLVGAERWLRFAQASEIDLEPRERQLLHDNLAAFHVQAARAVQSDSLRGGAPVVGANPQPRRSFAD